MTVRTIAKSIAFATLGSPPVAAARLRRIAASGVLTILSLHRIAPIDKSTYPPLNPQLFRELLSFCRANFEVVSFAELDRKAWHKPPLILSFDDGYKDFIDYAAPILEEFNLRCNQNLIPKAIESGLPPFNVILNDFAGVASDVELARFEAPGFRKYRASEGRNSWGNALSHWFKVRPMADQQRLAEVIIPQLGIGTDFFPTPVMTLEEVREISTVHELGAHSYEHANLSHESDDYAARDARRCKAWFAAELGLETKIYAIPNGDYRESQLTLIEAAGFTTVLLVGQRFSNPLRRRHFRFNFDASGLAEMRFKALGGVALLSSVV